MFSEKQRLNRSHFSRQCRHGSHTLATGLAIALSYEMRLDFARFLPHNARVLGKSAYDDISF